MKPSRDIVPLSVADVSQYGKTLRRLLSESGATEVPGHLALLNLLAKSAGYRNYQALRASMLPVPPRSDLPRTTLRALNHFDSGGRLVRWPTQFAVQQTALWGLWARLPAKKSLTEAEVNEYLEGSHAFGDPATLRRELVNAGLLWRTKDCREYRKEAKRPNAEVRAFLDTLFAAARPGSLRM